MGIIFLHRPFNNAPPSRWDIRTDGVKVTDKSVLVPHPWRTRGNGTQRVDMAHVVGVFSDVAEAARVQALAELEYRKHADAVGDATEQWKLAQRDEKAARDAKYEAEAARNAAVEAAVKAAMEPKGEA